MLESLFCPDLFSLQKSKPVEVIIKPVFPFYANMSLVKFQFWPQLLLGFSWVSLLGKIFSSTMQLWIWIFLPWCDSLFGVLKKEKEKEKEKEKGNGVSINEFMWGCLEASKKAYIICSSLLRFKWCCKSLSKFGGVNLIPSGWFSPLPSKRKAL